jgi:phenylalanine-4-hydroxylase
MPASIPPHLRRYVVEQDYSRYTPVDQEVWRYVMRQLKSFLATHAHPCYIEGLAKTGIEVDRIPEISRMSEKLEKFGWRAVPVSGFIPPAAFMELQALGFLPIACDIRTIEHLTYTPAPDIVHEAAGHAPILVDPAFAAYLKAYAQVARKAIISKEDMDQYEAIRVLSDLKEDPSSTPEQIAEAEKQLTEVSTKISQPSEAAILGRMNWWTAEYGLIGSLDDPKIFGAGLLSSVGEARTCLGPTVKKIPFTLDCINYTYDITEPQPQLFVTPDFHTLTEVLEQLSTRMAYRMGGIEGLKRAKLAATVNTVELNSGLQISGQLKEFIAIDDVEPVYLQFEGRTQLSVHGTQLSGHGTATHTLGFGSPVGYLEDASTCLSEMSDAQLHRLGIAHGRRTRLKFRNGVEVHGEVTSFLREADGRLVLVSFRDCSVVRGGQVLFEPAWGTYDMAVGTKIVSVFGGPADREAYGVTDDFAAKVIPRKSLSPLMKYKHQLYQEARAVADGLKHGRLKSDQALSDQVEEIVTKVEADFPHEWLLRLVLLELAEKLPSDSWRPRLELELKNLGEADPTVAKAVEDGKRFFGVN